MPDDPRATVRHPLIPELRNKNRRPGLERCRQHLACPLAGKLGQGVSHRSGLVKRRDRGISRRGVSLLGRFWQAHTPATIRRLLRPITQFQA